MKLYIDADGCQGCVKEGICRIRESPENDAVYVCTPTPLLDFILLANAIRLRRTLTVCKQNYGDEP